MRLYLVQHGEALPKERDPDRPLSGPGRADVERLADFLAKRGVRAQRVLHSGKTRARQTAELLARALGGACEGRSGLAPNDPTGDVVQEASDWTDDVVLVGHLPFMGRLAARLVAGREDACVAAFRPGGMLCLERGEEGGWEIAWMLRPELTSG